MQQRALDGNGAVIMKMVVCCNMGRDGRGTVSEVKERVAAAAVADDDDDCT